MSDDASAAGAGPVIEPNILAISRAVQEAGGKAYLVGGWVRDLALLRNRGDSGSPAAGNYDLEVFGLTPERLVPILERHGAVHLVGESFAVYKVVPRFTPGMSAPPDLDVSLPRRDTKVGRGHRGFQVQENPTLSLREAARRRDFTINAMLLDPLTGETFDPWDGLDDLRAGRLRAVDPVTFVEDSLRVLRALQFAARLGFDLDPQTADLCRGVDLTDLPAERIWSEMEKLLLSPRPSIGLDWALRLGVVDQLFPALKALVGCRQDPDWHPEGDVWVHTLLAIDCAVQEIKGLPQEKQLAIMLAVLCHDFGKPSTTAELNGRIRSFDHEAAGIEPTARFLDRLKIHTLGGYDLRGQVLALVKHHLAPSHFHKNRHEVGDGAFRRLAGRLEPELLYRVSRADCLGRTGKFSTVAQEWFIERARSLGVEERAPQPILMGRHLLEMGLQPGPEIGRVCRSVYEMQLDGRVIDLESALDEARRLLSGRACD